MLSRACSIWLTFSGVQASRACCTTDCSAQRLASERCLQGGVAAQTRVDFDQPVRSCQHADKGILQFVNRGVLHRLLGNAHGLADRPKQIDFTPMAARLALAVKCRSVCVINWFMMMALLSLVSFPSIGMAHHPSFGKSLSFGSILPLLWTKFR